MQKKLPDTNRNSMADGFTKITKQINVNLSLYRSQYIQKADVILIIPPQGNFKFSNSNRIVPNENRYRIKYLRKKGKKYKKHSISEKKGNNIETLTSLKTTVGNFI